MVFGKSALEMHDYGLAVLPIAADRQPLVSGFNCWRRRPSSSTVGAWVREHPNSNVAVHPGLSGVIIADVDDATQDDEVRSLLGDTPLQVQTRRGLHRYYRKPTERLPGNLRALGLNVDLKAGSAIVIAPPSAHESGHIYSLKGCDWSDLRRLPPLNIANLKQLVRQAPRNQVSSMRDGSRGQWLNDRLCGQVHQYQTFDQLLARARDLNQHLADRGLPLLPEAEVIRRTRKLWQDAETGKVRALPAFRGTLKTSVQELDLLNRQSVRRGPNALFLLLKLREMHSARCARGETYCITPRAMANAEVIAGWTRERYAQARDVLLQAKLIVKVKPFRQNGRQRQAAQYALAEFRDRFAK